MGLEIYKKLDALYSNFQYSYYNRFSYNPYRKSFIKLDQCKNITEQIDNYVYKIKIEKKEVFGFFCKIPLSNKNITMHVKLINKKDAKILIEFQKEKKIKELILKNRKKYTSQKYNITIIEIKKEDQIDNYLELEEGIIKGIGHEQNLINYSEANIYMINYKIGKFTVAFSFIKCIYNEYDENKIYNFKFGFRLDKKILTNGAPIFLFNNKLIGIINNMERKYYDDINGIFLSFPIKEFIETIHN